MTGSVKRPLSVIFSAPPGYNHRAFVKWAVENGGPEIDPAHVQIVLLTYKRFQKSPEAKAEREAARARAQAEHDERRALAEARRAERSARAREREAQAEQRRLARAARRAHLSPAQASMPPRDKRRGHGPPPEPPPKPSKPRPPDPMAWTPQDSSDLDHRIHAMRKAEHRERPLMTSRKDY